MGLNKLGPTAAILSTTKIDATQFPNDAALDLGLSPSAVQGADGLDAMYGLLKTFISLGGHALQINVFDADTLRKAQNHPEKYHPIKEFITPRSRKARSGCYRSIIKKLSVWLNKKIQTVC